MKILCYVRPWNKKQLLDISRTAFSDANILYMADFLGMGGENLQELFYQKYNSLSSNIDLNNFDLTQEELDDFILRCRLLRSIDKAQAQKMFVSMLIAIREIFDRVKPDLIISLTIDSYVIDIINFVANKNNIKFFGIVPNFINGYFRLTARGEYVKLHTPTSKEIENIYESIIVKNQKAHFLSKIDSKMDIFHNIFYNYYKNVLRFLYFVVIRLFTNDKLNYHYWTSYKYSPISVNFEVLKLVDKNFLFDSDNKNIYIPLQFFPEATVDYWVQDHKFLDYNNVLFELLKKLDGLDNTTIYIKEHPAMLGFRSRKFYKSISNFKNIKFIPMNYSFYDIVDNIDAAIVWTGSAGFESALYGKKVFHLGNPYYIKKEFESFVYCDSLDEVVDGISKLDIRHNITKEEQKELIAFILSSCVKGTFKQPKKQNGLFGKWVYDKETIRQLSNSINQYYFNKSLA